MTTDYRVFLETMDSHIPEKCPGDNIESFEEEQRTLNNELRVAKKRLKARGSFNAEFWARSSEVEDITVRKMETRRKISWRDFPGTESEWQRTEEAKGLLEQIKAGKSSVATYKTRAEQLDNDGSGSKAQRLRAASMKVFTTSKMGLNFRHTGAGDRDGWTQTKFRRDMMAVYGSKHPTKKWVWCPILSSWRHDTEIRAGHLFAAMHGQDLMDAIFGRQKEPELFSPTNGLLISKHIGVVFDSGKLVIVPDLPDRPKTIELLSWLRSERREYKIRVIDHTWSELDDEIVPDLPLTFRALDNKRVEFLTDFRPSARYLYYHYCLQVLRRAWQQDSGVGSLPGSVLRDEMGKPFWSTPGHYLPKNMLLAIVEELGHEYQDLLSGAAAQQGESRLLLDVACKQVKARRPQLADSVFGDQLNMNDNDDEDDDDDDDNDDNQDRGESEEE